MKRLGGNNNETTIRGFYEKELLCIQKQALMDGEDLVLPIELLTTRLATPPRH